MTYFPFAIVKVKGGSMLPTYQAGDFLLISPLPYLWSQPQHADIVVARVKGQKIVKRIAAIKNNDYILAGDNPKASTDSRQYGPVHAKQILAKVLLKF